jgi:hypothetical protein
MIFSFIPSCTFDLRFRRFRLQALLVPTARQARHSELPQSPTQWAPIGSGQGYASDANAQPSHPRASPARHEAFGGVPMSRAIGNGTGGQHIGSQVLVAQRISLNRSGTVSMSHTRTCGMTYNEIQCGAQVIFPIKAQCAKASQVTPPKNIVFFPKAAVRIGTPKTKATLR